MDVQELILDPRSVMMQPENTIQLKFAVSYRANASDTRIEPSTGQVPISS